MIENFLNEVSEYYPIDSKEKFYNLYEKGIFGNKLRSWKTLDEFKNKFEIHKMNQSVLPKSVSLRSMQQNTGLYTKYNVKVNNIEKNIEELISLGSKREWIRINESAPDEFLLIQGEFGHFEYNGNKKPEYELTYNTRKGKMRDCMIYAKTVKGIQARQIMEQYLNIWSFTDIMELIDLYPNHVIEFSTYKYNLGTCPNRNTIIWEVRQY